MPHLAGETTVPTPAVGSAHAGQPAYGDADAEVCVELTGPGPGGGLGPPGLGFGGGNAVPPPFTAFWFPTITEVIVRPIFGPPLIVHR